MDFQVSSQIWSGKNAVVLSGPDGAKATILPSVGSNVIQLCLPVAAGEAPVELVSLPPDAAALLEGPSHFGCPILFPFPSRVSGGRFTYAGQTYQLDVRPDGNALHGFLLTRAFTVTEQGADHHSAWVTMSFNADIPEIQRQFPFPFRFTITYRLTAQGLAVDANGLNTGDRPMPMGFGWHPYFNMPMRDGNRGDCLLQVPCDLYWELAADLVPTGRRLPVTGKLDMRAGLAVGDNAYDDMLSGVQRDQAKWSHASLIDPAAKIKATVSAGPTFREWVIYAPPGKNTVCLEPYTCAGNAFNLQAAGVDAGVITLAPGQTWSDSIRVSVAQI